MKSFYRRGLVLITVALALSHSSFAQEEDKYDMGKMQMVFLNLNPAWKSKGNRSDRQIVQEHRKYVDGLITSGKCALAGIAKGEGPIREILVFKVEGGEEIIELTKTFPAVKAGMMTADVLAWYAARNVINAPTIPLQPTEYVFGLLVRGDKWTPEKTPETEKIQEGHMANINRLAEMGKLVLAGPFFDDGNRRGVFIFKVDSLKEAQDLTDTDPAVKAGRLRIELYQWSVPRGMLK
jgi:uncharacterized protein YciI